MYSLLNVVSITRKTRNSSVSARKAALVISILAEHDPEILQAF
jgi:hypothetical protein